MTIEIKAPVLPESVADALLLEWSKQPGDRVHRDEILVEVETDKVALEVPSPADGILSEIIEQTGATVLSGQALARIETGADADAGAGEKVDDLTVLTEMAEQALTDIDSVKAGSPGTDSPARGVQESGGIPSAGGGKFGPAARRLMDENGLDAAQISGSGRDGLITREDALHHIATAGRSRSGKGGAPAAVVGVGQSAPVESAPAPAAPAGADSAAPDSAGEARRQNRIPMSRLRQTIADRLLHSQRNAALLTTFNEVNMQPVMELRSRYKEAFEKKHGARLGFMSFFVKASVAGLQKFPLVNSYIDGTDIVQHNYCDIGIAVASPRGLVVPVLRSCESMDYAQVEQQIQEFGARAKQGKIAMDELTGGTFTITNGGVFGSLLSTPIVNPPQSAILGMHKIQQRPMAEEGEVVVRPMMYLALSYDHRIIDGKEAVQFLVTIKDMLEDPARLLLDC